MSRIWYRYENQTEGLVVDVSGSGLFGSRDQSKRELAAEIASVLAFSAIRNNDKVASSSQRRGGEIHPAAQRPQPRPARHPRGVVLRAEAAWNESGECAGIHGTRHGAPGDHRGRVGFISADSVGPLPKLTQTRLRMLNRKHDVVAVQITDKHELELPALGRFDSRGRGDGREFWK